MDICKMSMVPCAVWVAQGKALCHPEKVEICQEDLEKIIENTQNKLKTVNINSEGCESDDSDWEDDDSQEDVSLPVQSSSQDVDMEEVGSDATNAQSLDICYSLATYDEEKEDPMGQVCNFSDLAVYINPGDDPLLAAADQDSQAKAAKEEDDQSECDNEEIKPTDNLLAIGHSEINDSGSIESTLEVYVYNDDGIYPHHENLLPEMPLCMEWLNYMPDVSEKGNLVAVGSTLPYIEVWDLDLIDGLEAAYTLGSADVKKKSKRKSRNKAAEARNQPVVGHSDAILALAWNTHYDHVLASGSADGSVILWDLQQRSVSNSVSLCKNGHVQSIQWHPTDATTLLAGTTAGTVHVIDCHDMTHRSYKLDGKVEKTIWVSSPGASDKPDAPRIYYVMACNDQGTVWCIDHENYKILWNFNAHEKASVEALEQSSSCPGLLVTGSEDGRLRVWDTRDNLLSGPPTLVVSMNPNVGRIITVKAAIEQPFVFCVGGDSRDNLFEIWDIRESKNVRRTFCPRLGLPTDEDGTDTTKLKMKKSREDSEDEGNDGDKQSQAMQQALKEECAAQGARVHDGRIAKPRRNKKNNRVKKSQ